MGEHGDCVCNHCLEEARIERERKRMPSPSSRLDEFDRDEWFNVMRRVRPGLSRPEFDEIWGKFQREKVNRRAC